MSDFTIQDPAYIFFFLAPSLPAPFHFSSNKQGSQIARFRNQNPLKKACPDSSSQEIPHIPIARLSYPTTAMATAIPRTSYQQQHTAADQEQREEETNQRTENGAGVTFTGHEVRKWRQTSRESATEEIRDTESKGAAKALPPKDTPWWMQK